MDIVNGPNLDELFKSPPATSLSGVWIHIHQSRLLNLFTLCSLCHFWSEVCWRLIQISHCKIESQKCFKIFCSTHFLLFLISQNQISTVCTLYASTPRSALIVLWFIRASFWHSLSQRFATKRPRRARLLFKNETSTQCLGLNRIPFMTQHHTV